MTSENEKRQNVKKQESEPKNQQESVEEKPVELGGPAGLEPTRYGDWERKGRCIDF
ncbi:MAG: DUF1674 domain-containing protein [Gammaproteobacteria bacterium]|nr:DUF1674 domain-containing protein [Gammaproteobacteria bacterium]